MSEDTTVDGRVTSAKARRNAIITAATVEVGCPHCGEPQPSPVTGSHLWLPAEVAKEEGPRTCVSCDETFRLHAQSRVTVQA